jgi:hypothetical protein
MKKIIVIAFAFCLFIFLPVPSQFVSNQASVMREQYLKLGIDIQLPSTMQFVENPLHEREQLLYSLYLNDNELSLRGYLQVWELEDIEKFLADSKKQSPFDFNYYSTTPIELTNLSGLENEWGASFGNNIKISGKEYWLKKAGSSEVLRIAFLTSKASFSEEQVGITNRILHSLIWK